MSPTGVVGLALARPARMLGIEPFFAELIAGIQERLSAKRWSLLLQVVPDQDAEVVAYRRWAEEAMVEAVIVVNLHTDDIRIPLLHELGIPAVAIGGTPTRMPISNIWVDDARAVRDAVTYLALLGHHHIGRVSGPTNLHHTKMRDAAFAAECEARGVQATVVEGDYSEQSGRGWARALLGRPGRPSAIIFDNDVMALAGLSVAVEFALNVPADLSIIAWDDSSMCRLSNPPLSAMTLDVHEMGLQTADALLNTLAGGAPTTYRVPHLRMSVRDSTAPLTGPDPA